MATAKPHIEIEIEVLIMDVSEFDEQERMIIQQIKFLQRQYKEAVKPYYEKLTQLRNLRPTPPIIIWLDEIARDKKIKDLLIKKL